MGPLLLCGILCLTALRHVGLWCAWAVYVPQQICWSWATALTWRVTLWTARWTPEMNDMRLAIGWMMLAAMAGLLAGSLWAFRKVRLAPKGRTWALGAAAVSGGILLLALRPRPLALLLAWSGLDFGLLDAVGLAILTAGLCLCAALLRGRARG